MYSRKVLFNAAFQLYLNFVTLAYFHQIWNVASLCHEEEKIL